MAVGAQPIASHDQAFDLDQGPLSRVGRPQRPGLPPGRAQRAAWSALRQKIKTIFIADLSAELWANQHLFELDAASEPTAIKGRGVPGPGDATDRFLPHNHEADTVVFTGTHNTDTVAGWWAGVLSAVKCSLGMPADWRLFHACTGELSDGCNQKKRPHLRPL